MADRGRGRGPPAGGSRGPPPRGRGPRGDRGDSRGRGGSPARGRGGPPQRGGSPSGASSSSGVSGPVYNVSGGPLPTPNPQASENEDAVARAILQSRPAVHPIMQQIQDMSKSPADIDNLAKEMATVSVEELSPYRPAYGTNGKPVRLWANYMEFQIPRQADWHRYAIRVADSYQRVSRETLQWETRTRPVPNPKKRRIIHLFLHENFAARGVQYVSDFSGLVLSSRPLPDVPDTSEDEIRAQVIYRPEEDDDIPEESAQVRYTVILRKIDAISTADLFKSIMSTQATTHTGQKADVIQAANIIVNYWSRSAAFDPEEMMINISKFCQNPAGAARGFNLGAGLRALRGFAMSVRPGAARMLLNVQVKNVAIYPNISLVDLIQEYLSIHARNFRALESFLRKLRVSLTHLRSGKKNAITGKPNRRVKTVMSLARPSDGSREKRVDVRTYAADAYDVKFYTDDGKQMSVADHFKRTYNVLCTRGVPVVNCGSALNPIYLPPDVCHVEPAQPPAARLSPDQTANMIRFAVRKPFENATTISRDAPRKLRLNSERDDSTNASMEAFGIKTASQLITVPGRILSTPNVMYSRGKTARVQGGRWNMRDITFTLGRPVNLWAIMWVSRDTRGRQSNRGPSKNDMGGAVIEFVSELNRNGVSIGQPASRRSWTVPHDVDEYQYFKNQIQADVLTLPRRPDIVLFAFDHADTAWYNHIKSLADCTFGFHSVCVVDSKFAHNRNGQYNRQYFANVALKFNLKLKGRNQVLDPSKLGIVAQGKTMLVGIDVTHPSATSSDKAPSVAGSVATIDSAAVQYLPSLYVQRGRQEMVANLDGMFKRHLTNWKKANKGQLPENILIYRDGVSEGQYRLVLERELPEIRRSCHQAYSNSGRQPKLTIVVVGKRHHTRFYPTSAEADVMDQRSFNPLNGTVVDRGVTEPRNWDFYLQSHTALQGTARPAHYYVVIDEIFTSRKPLPQFRNHADELEELTHNLCYLFGRATMAVSICPPAYYADLVCERARRYLATLFEPPTPTGSQTGSISGGQTNLSDLAAEGEFKINPTLQESMFYI